MPPVRIPVYQQQTSLQDGAPVPSTPMDVPTNNVGSAIEGLGQAASQYASVQAMLQKDAATTEGARVASEAGLDAHKLYADTVANAPVGGYGMTDSFVKGLEAQRTARTENVTDRTQLRYINHYFDTQKEALGSQMYTQELNLRGQYAVQNVKNATTNVATNVGQHPDQYNNLVAPLLASISTLDGVDGNQKLSLTQYVQNEASVAAAMGVAKSNPAAIVGAPGVGATATRDGSPTGGFLAADQWIADKEGGFVANDNGHGPTNFGINSQANPDVDVANLTPEKASQIRKGRYWDAINGDALPPALQKVAYNFAIQAGAGAANKLLTQADGDPSKFNDLAKGYYADIATNNPNQAANVPMWQQRSDQALAQGASAPAANEPAFMSNLTFGQRLQVFGAAKTQQNQDMALGRVQLAGHLADAQAQATQGIPDAQPVTLPQLLKAYPPDEAALHYSAYQDGQQLAKDVGTLKSMPSTDMATLVAARAPLAGPGYAQAQHDHQILTEAMGHVMEQRNSDPAQYVMGNAPAVQSSYAQFAANPNPSTAQNYAQASVAEQNRLGIKQPQLLTKGQVAGIEGQINDNGGANGYDVIKQQASLWGPQWGTVASQLKNIPPAAKTLGYLLGDIDEGTGRMLWDASRTPPDKLTDGLVPANVTAAKNELISKSSDFAKTLSFTPGGQSTFSALYDSAERLSYVYMKQGDDASSAADKAYNVVMGKQFNVSGMARVPARYDAGVVNGNAQTMLDGLDTHDLMLPPAPQGMASDAVKQAYTSNLKSNGHWITSSDGKGLVLFDPVSSSVVRTKDGQPVGASFDTLSKKAAKQAIDPNYQAPGIDASPLG